LPLPHPPAPASHQEDIYLHTDNINKPDASVRHKLCPERNKVSYKLSQQTSAKVVVAFL
jgi:hypothetical protein